MQERIKNEEIGDLAVLLNRHRNLDVRRGSSHVDFYLTNECDRRCGMCYTASLPGLKSTRLNFELAGKLMDDFKGADYATITGGEISILPDIDTLIIKASHSFKKVFVQTNAIGFVQPNSFRTPNPVDSVLKDLEARFWIFPANTEIVIPATEFHMSKLMGGNDNHKFVLRATSILAHKWLDKPNYPQVRFIAKNTPLVDGSGQRIIEEYGLQDLAKTGMDNFPGNITSNGRGSVIDGSLNAREIGNTKSLDNSFEGGFCVNYNGVYTNEGPLLYELLSNQMRGEWLEGQGKICSLKSEFGYVGIRNKIKEFLINFPN